MDAPKPRPRPSLQNLPPPDSEGAKLSPGKGSTPIHVTLMDSKVGKFATFTGASHVVNVDLQASVADLKGLVEEMFKVRKDSQEVMFLGNKLEDEATLAACGMKEGVTIHVLSSA